MGASGTSSLLPSRAYFFIAACVLLPHVELARAQQAPPLQGQGVSPCVTTRTCQEENSATEIFTSVELLRLMEIDDRSYEFRALLNIQQTWEDERAKAAFRIINAMDLQGVNASTASSDLYASAVRCGTAGAHAAPAAAPAPAAAAPNLTSPDCVTATKAAPDCKKYCTTYGTGTDNRFRCCDLVWLPTLDLSNIIDITQDRIVYDTIFSFVDQNKTYVHRVTRIHGRFFTPLEFRKYPFDRQRLFVFLDVPTEKTGQYELSPSATFRRLNPEFVLTPSGDWMVSGLGKDELAGWNIDGFTFTCIKVPQDPSFNTLDGTNKTRLWVVTQDYDPNDPQPDAGSQTDTCVLEILVSRLSSTLVVQSIVPVGFVGCLAFVVFWSSPDDIDLRLGTEVTLFLALTAVQFIFVAMLPLTSYLTSFDVFILLTYFTIVAIVIENLVVYYISTREEVEERRTGTRSREQEPFLADRYTHSISSAAPECPWGSHKQDLVNGPSARAPKCSTCDGQLDRLEEQAAALDINSASGKHDQNELSTKRVAASDVAGKEVNPDGFPPLDVNSGGPSAMTSETEEGRHLDGNMETVRAASPFSKIGLATNAKRELDLMFARDSGYAYRLSRKIDLVASSLLFVIYVVLSIVIFTHGL